MLLDHPFRQPVGNALAFLLITIDRPGFLPVFVHQPALLFWGGVNRVFGGENKLPARHQRLINRGEQPCQIFDVVQR
ncbi:hypothetical protein D3C87_2156400 [compost metagenome]